MPSVSDDQPVLCEKALALDGRPIIIRLREPVLDPDDIWREHVPDYRCAFEVDGFGEAVRGGARGVDGLAAIVAARTRVAYALYPFRRELGYPDGSGSYDWEFAYGVSLADAGRRRRVREIVDEETYAFAQDEIEREVMRRAKAASFLPKAGAGLGAIAANAASAASDPDSEAPSDEIFPGPPLCIRDLQSNGTNDIRVSIWRPTPVKAVNGHDGYVCGFTLTGLDDRHQRTFTEDAMSALFLAICATDAYLDPHRKTLTWFGLPYPDPAFSNVLDAGRRRRIHDIIEEEIHAIAEREREQREYREFERAQLANKPDAVRTRSSEH